MTGIRAAIADYLAVRRALGYKLADHGRLLAEFATFLEDRDAGTITTELALAWATRPGNALPSWWAARLRVVRGFARHVKAFDPATEIPPIGLLACSNRRAMPYVYADAEVCALMSPRRRCGRRCTRPPIARSWACSRSAGVFSGGPNPVAEADSSRLRSSEADDQRLSGATGVVQVGRRGFTCCGVRG